MVFNFIVFLFFGKQPSNKFPRFIPGGGRHYMNKKNNKSWRSVSQEIFQSFLKKQKN